MNLGDPHDGDAAGEHAPADAEFGVERDSADVWLDDVLAGRQPAIEPVQNSVIPRPIPSTSVSPGLRQLLDEATPTASPGLRELVANSVSDATRAAYERDWADFDLWCHIKQLGDPLDATALTVGEYVNELVRDRKAMSTINRRLAAIRFAQQLATGSHVLDDPLITKARAGAQRLLGGRGVAQATPLRLDEMRTIVTGLPIVAPNRPTMRRDQLAICLGWSAALRSSELVGLDVDDLSVVGDADRGDGGLLVRIGSSKTSTSTEYVAVPFASQWATCPVRRTIQYLRNAKSGPVFRHIDRHGRHRARLTARSISDIVRRCVLDCLRIDTAGYTSHSLRAGFVTEARAHNIPDELIARHTRHGHPGSRRGGILDVYDRPADRFERTALEPGWW